MRIIQNQHPKAALNPSAGQGQAGAAPAPPGWVIPPRTAGAESLQGHYIYIYILMLYESLLELMLHETTPHNQSSAQNKPTKVGQGYIKLNLAIKLPHGIWFCLIFCCSLDYSALNSEKTNRVFKSRYVRLF